MADAASLICFDCELVLPLGNFWNITEPGGRLFFDETGAPNSESPELTRAVWKLLAEHVYHEIRLIGQQSARLAEVSERFRTIGGDRAGVDPPVAEFLDGWQG